MNADGVLGGIHMPPHGSANATDLTLVLARGARMHGATIREHVKVKEVLTAHGRVTGVRTDQGSIQTDHVVSCGGMWARDLGRQNGIGVPLHACEHHYLVTEPIPDLPSDLPVLRSYCDGTYWKEDAGKLMVEGRDAETFLQRACTNDMALPLGKIAYTLMLNDRGGIESDVTVARHGPARFMVMSAISYTRRDRDELQGLVAAGEDVRFANVTTAYAVLSLCSPKSRDVLASVCDLGSPHVERFGPDCRRFKVIPRGNATEHRIMMGFHRVWSVAVVT